MLVLARTRDPATGRSVLADRRITCLPKYMERLAYLVTAWRLGRCHRTEVTQIRTPDNGRFRDGQSRQAGARFRYLAV